MKTLTHFLGLAVFVIGAAAVLPAAKCNTPYLRPNSAVHYTVQGPEKCSSCQSDIDFGQFPAPPIPYHTEYFVVNRTSKPIQVGLSQSSRAVQNEADVHEVARRDTLRGGEFIDEDAFGEYAQRIHFQINARKPKWMQGVAIDMEHPAIVQVDATHRRCYFFISKTKRPFY